MLFLIDPIDEVAIQNLKSYKEKNFVDISKEDLDLGQFFTICLNANFFPLVNCIKGPYLCFTYLYKTGDKNEEKEKEVKQEFGNMCDWIKKRLGDKVASVQISSRLSTSPCVLVSGKFGWSANMERCVLVEISVIWHETFTLLLYLTPPITDIRLMKAQSLGDTTSLDFMRGRRVFEINPEHPIIKDLNVSHGGSLSLSSPVNLLSSFFFVVSLL